MAHGEWLEWVGWAVAAALLARAWSVEVSDRKTMNRSFARLPESCVAYLRRVARTPSWRVSLATALAAALVQRALPRRSLLVAALVVFVASQACVQYRGWHIMCHANCSP